MTSFKGHLIFLSFQWKIIDRIHRIEDDKGFQLIKILYLMKCFTVNQSDRIRVFAVCNDDGEQLSFSNDDLWDIVLT